MYMKFYFMKKIQSDYCFVLIFHLKLSTNLMSVLNKVFKIYHCAIIKLMMNKQGIYLMELVMSDDKIIV